MQLNAGSGNREGMVTFVALVACCVIIAVSVSAVVGAVVYAGWMEPGSGLSGTCECCP